MSIPIFNDRKYDREYNAIMVPFKEGTMDIDYDLFREHVRRYTRDKDFLHVNGALIVNPEAGETFYLPQEEQDRLSKIVLEERPSGMPVISGFWGSSIQEVTRSALAAKKTGVDGLFVFPPTGTMEVSSAIDTAKNPEVWTDFVKTIAGVSQLPLIIHPAARWTDEWGGSLAIQSVKSLVEEVPSVVGYKMIYGYAEAHFRIARFLRSEKRHVAILNAPTISWETAKMLDMVDGAVSGAYNFQKELIIDHHLAWEEGDFKKLKKIVGEQLMPMDAVIYGDRSRLHIHYKIATWIRGNVPHPFMMPPMPPPRVEECEMIFKTIDKVGLSHITHSEFERVLGTRKEVYESFYKKALP